MDYCHCGSEAKKRCVDCSQTVCHRHGTFVEGSIRCTKCGQERLQVKVSVPDFTSLPDDHSKIVAGLSVVRRWNGWGGIPDLRRYEFEELARLGVPWRTRMPYTEALNLVREWPTLHPLPQSTAVHNLHTRSSKEWKNKRTATIVGEFAGQLMNVDFGGGEYSVGAQFVLLQNGAFVHLANGGQLEKSHSKDSFIRIEETNPESSAGHPVTGKRFGSTKARSFVDQLTSAPPGTDHLPEAHLARTGRELSDDAAGFAFLRIVSAIGLPLSN